MAVRNHTPIANTRDATADVDEGKFRQCLFPSIREGNAMRKVSRSSRSNRDSDVSGLHGSTAKCLRTRVGSLHACAYTQLQEDRYKNAQCRQNQSDPPTYTDSFTLGSLDRVPSAPCPHVAAFLQWCARKCTASIANVNPNFCLISCKC